MAKITTRTWVLLAALIFSIVVAAVAYFDTHFDQIADRVVPATDWVRFTPPATARPLVASSRKVDHGVLICNNDNQGWEGLTVQISGIYNAHYVALRKRLKSGDCGKFDYSQFAEPSWKRMQMPPNEIASKVEVLTASPANGYIEMRPR